MMDDFRPGNGAQNDQPNNETNPEPVQTYEQPVEPTPTEEAPVAAPVVAAKKKGRAGKWLLGGLLVVLLAGLGALAYWQWQEAENAKKSLSSVESQLAAARAESANAKPDKDEPPADQAPLTEDEKITLAASHYVCIQANAGCDKVTETVSKKQSPTVDKPGFAIVTAGDAATGAGMKIYLKSTSMGDWIVIYDGQNTPPEDVVKKFAIPAGFVN